MGVDGFIFERRSKRYYSYDRDYNLYAIAASDYLPQSEYNDGMTLEADAIRYDLYEKDAKVTSANVVKMCDFLIDGFKLAPDERERQRQWAAFHIKTFAQMLPDGEFFIRLDNDDAYDLIGDMHGRKDSWKGDYSQWVPNDT